MAQSRGIPLREGEPMSVIWPKVKAKHFKCPTDWGKAIYAGAGSPYIFQATQAKPDEHLQPLGPELVSGINFKPPSHESHDIISNHSPPTIGAPIIVMH
ncbi:hypothetical protein QL285_027384 [Trifolium repens]|nr:hypothetical protein QL285_027384 [Trifolium repens]